MTVSVLGLRAIAYSTNHGISGVCLVCYFGIQGEAIFHEQGSTTLPVRLIVLHAKKIVNQDNATASFYSGGECNSRNHSGTI